MMLRMEESETFKNGRAYLEKKRTILVGISPGNPHFHKIENLQKTFQFAKNNFNGKILLFIADKIHEHNYRAVGSSNPEKSARVKANSVRNKCKEALTLCGLQAESVDFINWIRDVETSVSYINAFNHVNHLYHVNDEFHHDIDEATHFALTSLKKGREKTTPANRGNNAIDLEEGVKYPLKELAFFSVLADIYDNCEEYVFIYHRHWSVLERFFDGYYDNTPKPCMGFYVLD